MSPRESSVLWALRRLELSSADHTVTGLSRALSLDEATVQTAVDSLLSAGFLSRTKENPERFQATTRGTEACVWSESYCTALLLDELHTEEDAVISEIVTAMDRLDSILCKLWGATKPA